MAKSNNRKVIYTAIFGDYNGLIPQPKLEGFDYICFTENPKLKAKPWKTVVVDLPFPDDLTRSNRHIKILPHQYLPDYDLSIYIDGNVWILGNFDHLLQTHFQNTKMATFSHSQTTRDPHNCIYQEHNTLMEIGERFGVYKDSKEKLIEHVDFLRKKQYPENNGLIQGSVLIRLHNDPEVISVMEDWWSIVKKYSKRDQLSFNYVAWENNFDFNTIPGDVREGNPYVYHLGQHRKKWFTKLNKVKLKIALGKIKIPKIG